MANYPQTPNQPPLPPQASYGMMPPPYGYLPPPPHGGGSFLSSFCSGCLGAMLCLIVLFFGSLWAVGWMISTSVSSLSNLAVDDSSWKEDSDWNEQHVSGNRLASNKIVVLELSDTIISGESFVKRIRQVQRDPGVRAVVLRIDSPGGTVSGSDLIYHHLTNLRDGINENGGECRKIPIVVSMGSVAASGGYYAAMCVGHTENTIFAEPMTLTGSIGVLIPHYNLSSLMDKIGAENDSIVSHSLKNAGSMTKPMTEEERAIFQALVDDNFARFKEVVCSGRKKFSDDPKLLDPIATGQIFTARQAVENGLVDQIGFQEDAVARAAELAEIPLRDTQVVKYRQDFWVQLFSSEAEGSMGNLLTGRRNAELETLDNLATPRAYMLWTAWPTAQKSND